MNSDIVGRAMITLRGDARPLRLREFVFTVPDSLLHTGRDGQTMIRIEWRVAA